jgi:hypothetical protein
VEKTIANLNLKQELDQKSFFEMCEYNSNNKYLRAIYFDGATLFGSGQMLDCLFSYSMHVLVSKSLTSKAKPLPTDIKHALFPSKDSVAKWNDFVQKLPSNLSKEELRHLIEDTFTIKPRVVSIDPEQLARIAKTNEKTLKSLDAILSDDADEPTTMETATDASALNHNQSDLIRLFLTNENLLLKIEITKFCTQRGLFMTSFVDGINEISYEKLDDLLIEETNDAEFNLNSSLENKIQPLLSSL